MAYILIKAFIIVKTVFVFKPVLKWGVNKYKITVFSKNITQQLAIGHTPSNPPPPKKTLRACARSGFGAES